MPGEGPKGGGEDPMVEEGLFLGLVKHVHR